MAPGTKYAIDVSTGLNRHGNKWQSLKALYNQMLIQQQKKDMCPYMSMHSILPMKAMTQKLALVIRGRD